MSLSNTQKWEPCPHPKIGDTLQWQEPLWAAPNKPRGKRDIIGEQQITAKLIQMTDILEFEVISATKLSSGDAPLSVKIGDIIKRKQSSIEKGACHKRIAP